MVGIVLPENIGVVLDRRSFILFGCSCKILRDATPKSLVILDGEFVVLRSRPHPRTETEGIIIIFPRRTGKGYFDV